MKRLLPITLLAGGFIFAFSVPAAKADMWNMETRITVNQPIQIGNTVLSPGTYVLKLPEDMTTDRAVVDVFNSDETKLITSALTHQAPRPQASDHSRFTFYEAANGRPPALKDWFYPDNSYGHEFLPPSEQ